MVSGMFSECIDRRLLAGAIADLTAWMAAFPVNELQSLPKFSPDDYGVPRTTASDSLAKHVGDVIYKDGNELNAWTWNLKAHAGNQNAVELQTDRRTILGFLQNVERLYAGYRHLIQEEFKLALDAFASFPGYAEFPGTVFAEPARLSAALTKSTLTYYLKKAPGGAPDNPWGGVHEYDAETDSRSPYAEKRHYLQFDLTLTSLQVLPIWGGELAGQISAFLDGLSDFYNYCLPMVRAEAQVGLGNALLADQIYGDLLAGTPGKSEGVGQDFFMPIALSPEHHEFVRVRKALNYLEWGDRDFARAHGRRPDDEATLVQSAKSKYEAAVQLLVGLNPILDHEIEEIDKQIQGVNASYQAAIDALENVPPGHSTWGLEAPVAAPSGRIAIGVKGAPRGRAVFGVAPSPQAREILSHAKAQLLKIAGHLNFLGYHDSYVPPQRYTVLWGRAREYADLAIDAEVRYLDLRSQAESEELKTRTLAQDAQLASYAEEVAELREAAAETGIRATVRKIESIDRRVTELQDPDIWSFLFGYVEMWGNVYDELSKGSALGAIKAIGSWFKGNITEQQRRDGEIETLLDQKDVLELENVITERLRLIASLERTVATMRSDQIRDHQAYLEAKELSSDIYHALASVIRRIARTYLAVATRFAYLAERAMVFETGGENIRLVKFDYSLPGIRDILAGDLLRQRLVMLDAQRSLSLAQRNHIKHIISLRQHYPVEFYKLVSTGETSFVTALDEFDKSYPGTYSHRLRTVDVLIQGPSLPDGFKGSLRNNGVFQVRSLQGTLGAAHLHPTREEWRRACKEFLTAGTAFTEVEGIRSYELPEACLVLSQYENSSDEEDAQPETRAIFEGFGVAGLWHLELPPHLNDADYKTITDVQIVLYLDACYDPGLKQKMAGYYDAARGEYIKGLIELNQEQETAGKLDRIGMLSLRTCFPNEFEAFANGEVNFALTDEYFPRYMVSTSLRKIVLSATDNDGTGVAGLKLHVENDAGFAVDLETRRNGFTESLEPAALFTPQVPRAPHSRAVSLTGNWSIRAADIDLARKVHDLYLFPWYEYRERRLDGDTVTGDRETRRGANGRRADGNG